MKSARIEYLDGWRGVAILLLLIGHFVPLPGLSLGTTGVDFFFALSGLLMGKLLFTQKTPIPTFYRRRISRIFPAHYVFLGALIVYFLLINKEVDWKAVCVSALFLYNYFPILGHDVTMPFGHIWSLSVEEHSYILLSLVAILSRRGWINPTKVVGFLALVSASFGILYPMLFSGLTLTKMMMHTEVRGFSIFISVFFLLLFEKVKIPALPWETYLALICFSVALYWWSIPGQLTLIVGSGLLALIVNLLHVAPNSVHRVLSIKPLRQFGMWSFSIYLWQQPFYMAYGENFSWWLAGICGVLMGIVSFYFVERPARKYLNNTWGKE